MSKKLKFNIDPDRLRKVTVTRDKLLTVRMSEELYNAFRGVCGDELGGVMMSEVVRGLVAQVVESYGHEIEGGV